MRALLSLCIVTLSLMGHAQTRLSGRSILRDSLPCMEKALSLDGPGIYGKTADEVANIMCDHKPFARGSQVIVYMEPLGSSTVTTIFRFKDNACQQVIISISYRGDELSKRDEHFERFRRRFDEVYAAQYNAADHAFFSARRNETSSTYGWGDRNSFIVMSVVDRAASHSIEITRSYR